MASKRAIRRARERAAARAREERRKRSCEGKRRHENVEAAIAHLTHYRYKFNTSNFYYYPCEFCGGYHTGHKSEEEHQRTMDRRRRRTRGAVRLQAEE